MKKRDILSPSCFSNKTKGFIFGIIILLLLTMVTIICLSCINQKKHKAESLITKGNGYFDKTEYDMAELCYKEAVALEPDNANGYMALEKIYLAKDNYSDAVAVLESGYKKTEDEAIFAELERIKERSDNVPKVNRSELTVTEPSESNGVSESSAFALNNISRTMEAPGKITLAKPEIPTVDSADVESVREAASNKDEEKKEDAKEESKNEDSSEESEVKTDKQDNSSSDNHISINIKEDVKTVSFEQWKRWYHQWQFYLKKNDLESSETDLAETENEWEIWYQNISEGRIDPDGKVSEVELGSEESWKRFQEFWDWLTENL